MGCLLATHQSFLLDIRYSHNIGKNSCCRYAGSGTVTLYEHRVLLVALGGEQDNIVAAFEVVEGVVAVYFAQRYASLAILIFCDESPTHLLALHLLTLGLEVGVKVGQALPEILKRTLEKFKFAGKVGTGFSDKTKFELLKTFKQLIKKTKQFLK